MYIDILFISIEEVVDYFHGGLRYAVIQLL